MFIKKLKPLIWAFIKKNSIFGNNRDPCPWSSPQCRLTLGQRSQIIWIVIQRWLLIINARTLKVTVPGKMLKMNMTCTQLLMWMVKIGLKGLQTVSEYFMDYHEWNFRQTLCSCDFCNYMNTRRKKSVFFLQVDGLLPF